VVGDHLYLVSDTGVFSCVELATGRIAWQERRSGRHSASPVESGGLLWWCDEDGTTVVTKATPERFELLAENKLDAGCMASPAVVGDDLVIRTKTHLYRIGAGKP
jgi:outer membrane protein assembly factor BamB